MLRCWPFLDYMWWFPALASLLIGNGGRKDTAVQRCWRRLLPESMQLCYSLDTPSLKHRWVFYMASLLWSPPNERSQGFCSHGVKWIFAKAAQQLSLGEFRILGPGARCPPPLSTLGDSKGAVFCSIPRRGAYVSPKWGSTWVTQTRGKDPKLTKCLLGLKSFRSWELHVATLRKAK